MPLNLVNCGICGKATVVDEEQRHICDACREEELQLYRRVRALISENPGAGFTIWDVADKLKEDEGKITHLLDSG
ncbi:MAG: hypothetical protein FWE55_05845, partial [Synergistaceae bacterium]|nr:hypothetical protein [Synergistaceae bacterium]